MGLFLFIAALGLPYFIVLAFVLVYRGLRTLARLGLGLWAAAPTATAEPELAQKDARAIVVLVHGTFARGAGWTLPGSPLRAAIRAGLDGFVSFKTLRWSGRNTMRARATASAELRGVLRASMHAHPRTPHIVLGHSHGGTVAMNTVSDDPKLRDKVQVVCLSTPFIVLRRRRASVATNVFNLLFPFVLCIGVINLLNGYEVLPESDLADVLSFFASLGFAFAFRHVTQVALSDIAQAYTVPRLPHENALLVRTLGDEATIGIAAASLASKVSHAVLFLPMSVLEGAHAGIEAFRGRHHAKAKYALVAGLLLVLPFSYMSLDGNEATMPVHPDVALGLELLGLALVGVAAFLGTGGGWLLAIAMFVLSILAFPVIALMFLLSLAAGTEMALAALYFDASAESTPPGDWQVTLVQTDENSDAPRPHSGGLQHSLAYQDQGALEYVADWIRTRVEAGVGTERNRRKP